MSYFEIVKSYDEGSKPTFKVIHVPSVETWIEFNQQNKAEAFITSLENESVDYSHPIDLSLARDNKPLVDAIFRAQIACSKITNKVIFMNIG